MTDKSREMSGQNHLVEVMKLVYIMMRYVSLLGCVSRSLKRLIYRDNVLVAISDELAQLRSMLHSKDELKTLNKKVVTSIFPFYKFLMASRKLLLTCLGYC